ncbi:hypothetical protein [uncultured Thiohalocapsa sp.]|uniref:phage major capsid protein n=1 Tax=uncultured Thiohalocapsa sp. TaxID=768990 RepID=UPI002600E1BA|nr:hypothetical protein [uncultured Thiohalocapsa sp.]
MYQINRPAPGDAPRARDVRDSMDAMRLPEPDRREIARDAIVAGATGRTAGAHPFAQAFSDAGAARLLALLEGVDLSLADEPTRRVEDLPAHVRSDAAPLVAELNRARDSAVSVKRRAFGSAQLIDVVQAAAQAIAQADNAPTGEHDAFMRTFELADFRASRAPRIEPGDLADVTGSMRAVPQWEFELAGEMVSLQTSGATAAFTRQAIVNGQWFELAAIVRELAAAAQRAEREGFIRLLNDNPQLFDGAPMFDASRNNVVTAGASFAATLQAAAQALRDLKSAVGAALQPAPRALALPATHELDGSVREIADRAKLALLFDSRLTAGYLFPDPERRPVVGLGLLDGERRYEVRIKPDFHADAWQTRILHHHKVCPLSPHAVRFELP